MTPRRGTRIILAAGVVAVMAAAAFAGRPGGGEARAAENGPGVAFFTTIQNTDMVAAGFGGMRGNGTGTITVSGVSGTVRRALLYWHGPTNSASSAANAAVRFGGILVTGTHIGFSGDNCWSFTNSQAYRADVTALVAGNGQYALAEFRKELNEQVVAEVNGASLLVFFDDGNPVNNRDVVVFDGNDSNVSNQFDPDGWSVSLAGIDYASGLARLVLHVADGQPAFEETALILNGTELAAAGQIFVGDTVPVPPATDPDERLWDIKPFDVTSFLSPGQNTLTLTTGYVDDCLSLVAAAVDLPAGAAPASADVQLVSKTDEPDPVTVGQELRYTLSVRNNGPDGAFGVSVSDALPAGTTPVSAAASQGSCTLAQTVTCGLGFLGAGASATITIVVRPSAAGSLVNTATVTTTTPDPNSLNNSAVAATVVDPPSADVQLVSKTDEPDPVRVGEELRYTLSVRNDGPDGAFGVSVSLPAGTTPVSAAASQGSCTPAQTVTCGLGFLASGSGATVTIVVRPTAAGSLVNTATVSATTSDPNGLNNSAVAATVVDPPSADVQLVSKTDEPDPVTVGEELRYTLSVRNNGPDGAFGVSVSDPVPATATLVSAAASQGSCTPAQTVTCGLGFLAGGASATVTIIVRPGTAGDLANTATVSATTPDPNRQNNSAQASTTVAVIREP